MADLRVHLLSINAGRETAVMSVMHYAVGSEAEVRAAEAELHDVPHVRMVHEPSLMPGGHRWWVRYEITVPEPAGPRE